MWLILLVSSIFVDQPRIDEVMGFLRENYNQEIFQGQQGVVDDIIPGGPRKLWEYTPKLRADLVIGDTPAETGLRG